MYASEALDPYKVLAPNASLRSRRRWKAVLLVVILVVVLAFGSYRTSYHFWESVNMPGSGTEHGRTRNATWDGRAEKVKESFIRGYMRYQEFAFPDDELKPLTNVSVNNFNGWGVTAIDSLDTMILMDLSEMYYQARNHVLAIDFSKSVTDQVPFFETVIRYLGGLLSAFSLTKDRIFLSAADDLAKVLLPAFNTASRLPAYGVGLTAPRGPINGWNSGRLCLAEIGTFQMEYKYLAHLTQRVSYFEKAEYVSQHLQHYQGPTGIWPVWWNQDTGLPDGSQYSLGAAADSGYEYLLKGWLMSRRTENYLLDMHMEATRAAINQLVFLSRTRHLMYLTDKHGDRAAGNFQHLTCFMPGVLALSDRVVPNSAYREGEKEMFRYVAEGLAHTCWVLYADSLTGLGPEEVQFYPYNGDDDYTSGLWVKHYKKWLDKGPRAGSKPPGTRDPEPRNSESPVLERDYGYTNPSWLLRPEALEAMYLMWKTTGDIKWRERAYEMYQAIETSAHLDTGAYATVINVNSPVPMHADDQPSYFFAETLKYLYLTFTEDDPWPLDRFVFNTEAHPLPVFEWSVSEKVRFGMNK